MSADTNETGTTTLSPDDAFAVLGNDTRMDILRALGETEDSLSFSELRERVGLRDSGQFNYHLDQLEGHFVSKTDEEYELSQRGRRVIQAVLSGAITQAPTLEPTEIDARCYHCNDPIMVDYKQEGVGIYCTGCSGNFEPPREHLAERLGSEELAAELGVIGANGLPPAGILDRSPSEMLQAATAWTHMKMFYEWADLCPRCSASMDQSADICETHDANDGVCEACGGQQAIIHESQCTNCNFKGRRLFSLRLFGHTEFLHFVTGHGLNPIAPSNPLSFWGHFTPYEEEIISTDPFKAKFTFTIGEDAITLTVDDSFLVVDVTEHPADESNS
jgi:DNA-binding HxlR family transcriptional regulator